MADYFSSGAEDYEFSNKEDVVKLVNLYNEDKCSFMDNFIKDPLSIYKKVGITVSEDYRDTFNQYVNMVLNLIGIEHDNRKDYKDDLQYIDYPELQINDGPYFTKNESLKDKAVVSLYTENVNDIVIVLMAILSALEPNDLEMRFSYCYSCSKLRAGDFGGGICVVKKVSYKIISYALTTEMLYDIYQKTEKFINSLAPKMKFD